MGTTKRWCYEPKTEGDPSDADKRIAAALALVPLLQGRGNGSEFQKHALALVEYFEEKGVKTGLQRVRKFRKGRRQQCWEIDDTELLEYASMMGVTLSKYEQARKTCYYDSLRARAQYTMT